MWLAYAFSGPLLWAVSTHIDKFLVDKYFRHSDTAVLMVFTAFLGVLALPVLWLFDPSVLSLPWLATAVMTVSGVLYMGAMLFLSARHPERRSLGGGAAVPGQHALHLRAGAFFCCMKYRARCNCWR